MGNAHPIRLAITMGDPAGVGPEIILRLFEEGNFPAGTVPFVVGEGRHLEEFSRLLGVFPKYRAYDSPPEEYSGEFIPVVEPQGFHFEGKLDVGRVSAECGAAAWAYVREAVHLVEAGMADAVVTAPLHKEALKAAGCPHPGHTELLAELAGGVRVGMLLVGGGVRVSLATIHEPISKVPELLSRTELVKDMRLLDSFIPLFGIGRTRPRIGVTGLNPHAGEGGMFGDEEKEIIAPAIADAQAERIDAVGPLPGDTVFHFQREGAYDAVLAMYHDQALIPVKTLDFHGGVNVTMGLPFIRTSVDHGTAFNIAGQGIARVGSLKAALETAAILARNKKSQPTRPA